MRTIWKYTLPIDDIVTVSMPRGAQVLSVAEQDGQVCVWALVHSLQAPDPVLFRICGTGHPVGNCVGAGDFIGSVVMPNGLVWHVFREGGCGW
jgi:hypothetical protein